MNPKHVSVQTLINDMQLVAALCDEGHIFTERVGNTCSALMYELRAMSKYIPSEELEEIISELNEKSSMNMLGQPLGEDMKQLLTKAMENLAQHQ